MEPTPTTMFEISTVFDDASMLALIIDAVIAGPVVCILLLFVSYMAQNRAKKGS